MSKRYYTRQIRCSNPECKQVGHFSYGNQAEMTKHYKDVNTWTCVRHSYPSEVLGTENLKITSEQTIDRSERHNDIRFWSKCKSGFTYGDGFKAYAYDFPDGTILKITAEIILPLTNDNNPYNN